MARVVVVILLGVLLTAELVKEVVFGSDWRPQPVAIAENFAFRVFGVWMAALILRPADGEADAVLPVSAPGRSLDHVHPEEARGPDASVVARLADLIEVDRVHLAPG